MGNQISRVVPLARRPSAAVSKDAQKINHPPSTQPPAPPQTIPISSEPLHSPSPSIADEKRVANAASLSAAAPRASGKEWANLLNDISGSISSQTWEGTVGVRTARPRDLSEHAARRSDAYTARQPRRVLPGSAEMQASAAEALARRAAAAEREGKDAAEGDDGRRALAEISAALDGDVDAEVERRRGRVNQNQVLDVFRLRREEGERWTPEALAEAYELNVEDVRNLLKYSRTVLAVQVGGIGRGMADPQRRIERFEDAG